MDELKKRIEKHLQESKKYYSECGLVDETFDTDTVTGKANGLLLEVLELL